MYQVRFTNAAVKSLKKLDRPIVGQILDKIDWLRENLDLIKPIPLKADLAGFFKLRVALDGLDCYAPRLQYFNICSGLKKMLISLSADSRESDVCTTFSAVVQA